MASRNILKSLLSAAVCVFLVSEVVTTSSFSRKLQTSFAYTQEEDPCNIAGVVRDVRTNIFQFKWIRHFQVQLHLNIPPFSSSEKVAPVMDNAGVVVYDNLSTTTFKVWLFCCWYINRTTVFVIEGLMNGVIPPAWHWYVDRITAVVADASVVVYDNLKSTTTFKMWLFCCWYINRITTFVTEELINGEIPSTLCCHANRLTTFVMDVLRYSLAKS